MIEQQEETAKMPSIIKTENQLLPQLKITSLLLGQGQTNNSNLVNVLEDISNLYLEVNVETINNITSLDEVIQDNEYYKYIQISVSIEPQQLSTTPITKNLLNSSGQINLQNKFVLKDINVDTFSLKIEQSFDFDSFASDNKISSEQKQLLINVYGATQSITYPILLDKKIIKKFDNGEISIVVDKRFLDGLDTLQENLQLKNNQSTNLYTSYFGQNFYQTHNNTNLTSFIVFDYQSFLRETSYFTENALQDYSYTIEITKDNNLIDVVSVSFANNNISFISKKSVSVLHNYESKLLLSVNESMDSLGTNTTSTYELNVTNKDKTFINFYNRLTNTGEFVDIRNSYDQLKNVINFATTRMDQTKSIYYLDPITLKFQEDFILFYQQKENYYNSTFNSSRININISEFLISIFRMYNKFSNNIITEEQIQDVVNLLVLQNTTYDLWQRMFNTLDKLFSTLENFLYDITVAPSVRRSKTFTTETKRSNYYYSLSNFNTYNLFPKFSYDQVSNSYLQNESSGLANYFTFKTVTYKNENDIQFDSQTYNAINAYLNTKLKVNNNQISNSSLLGFTNLEQFAVDVVEQDEQLLLETKNNPIKFNTLLNPNTVTKKSKTSNNYLKLDRLNDLDNNTKNTISNTNKMLLGLSSAKIIDTLSLNSLFPKLTFSKFNYNSDRWELIVELSTIKNNDLIKIEIIQEPEIFAINNVGIEQIDLVNTYFIIDGV
jgi:hypothetical protein